MQLPISGRFENNDRVLLKRTLQNKVFLPDFDLPNVAKKLFVCGFF